MFCKYSTQSPIYTSLVAAFWNWRPIRSRYHLNPILAPLHHWFSKLEQPFPSNSVTEIGCHPFLSLIFSWHPPLPIPALEPPHLRPNEETIFPFLLRQWAHQPMRAWRSFTGYKELIPGRSREHVWIQWFWNFYTTLTFEISLYESYSIFL